MNRESQLWNLIRLTVMGVLLLYLQVIVAPGLSIFGIVPNFMLAFVIFLNLNMKIIPSLTLIFILGTMQDLTTPNLLGINVLCYISLSWIVSSFHQNLDKEKFLSHFIIISLVNLVYFFIFFVVQLVLKGYSIKLVPLILFNILYNIIISIVFTFILSLLYRMKLNFNED
jgi:rod shape-determining protein MreD